MKKFPFSLLLGSSLLLGVNQSYSAEKVIDRFHPWFDYIKGLVKEMYNIDVSKAKFPEVPSNEKFQGAIKGDGQNWSICYRILKYNDLDEIEKKVFDKLKFDKNYFVHIIAFDGTYVVSKLDHYSYNLPKPGYFIQDLFIHYSKWDWKNILYYSNLCNEVHYDRGLNRFYLDWNKPTQH